MTSDGFVHSCLLWLGCLEGVSSVLRVAGSGWWLVWGFPRFLVLGLLWFPQLSFGLRLPCCRGSVLLPSVHALSTWGRLIRTKTLQKCCCFFKGFGCLPTGAKKCTVGAQRRDPDWIPIGSRLVFLKTTVHFPHLFPTFRTLPRTTPPQTPSPRRKILRCTCGILWFCSVSEAELAGRKQVASLGEFPSYVRSLAAMS